MELGITICCCICNKFSTKTIEISLIVSQTIAIITLFIFIIVIKLSFLSTYSIVLLLFSLILLIICLYFSILFRLWRSNGSIKTTKKIISINMAIAGIIFIITCFFSCAINEYLILNEFRKIKKYPCITDNQNTFFNINSKKKIYNRLLKNCSFNIISKFDNLFIYISFSCVELILILCIFFLSIIKDRISFESENRKDSNNVTRENSIKIQYDFENPIPSKDIKYQKRVYYPGQTNIISHNKMNINNPQIIINNSQIKGNNNLNMKNNNLFKNVSPIIKGNFSNNTQNTQINSSQSQISFPKSNFSSNKQLVSNIHKPKINQTQESTSERKF